MGDAMRFEIYQEGITRLTGLRNAGGDWRWELIGDDNLVVARGEGFRTREHCLRTVAILKTVSGDTPVVDRI